MLGCEAVRHSAICVVSFLLVVGCGCSGEATTPVQADDCEPLITEVTEILENGSTDCSETSDCGCHGGGMGPASGCGGIVNRATLDRLDPVATRFRASPCYPTVNCAPWQCTPTCEAGQCRNSSN